MLSQELKQQARHSDSAGGGGGQQQACRFCEGPLSAEQAAIAEVSRRSRRADQRNEMLCFVWDDDTRRAFAKTGSGQALQTLQKPYETFTQDTCSLVVAPVARYTLGGGLGERVLGGALRSAGVGVLQESPPVRTPMRRRRRGGDLYALPRGLRHHHHALCGRGRLLPDLLDGIALGGAVDPARMRPRHALPLRCVAHPLDTTSKHLTNSKSLTPSCCVTRCLSRFGPLTTHSSLLSVFVCLCWCWCCWCWCRCGCCSKHPQLKS